MPAEDFKKCKVINLATDDRFRPLHTIVSLMVNFCVFILPYLTFFRKKVMQIDSSYCVLCTSAIVLARRWNRDDGR
jgi:hypothetical protein